MTEIPMTSWFKSSHSGGSGTECVECAHTDTGTLVRDSKRHEGDIIFFREKAWEEFMKAMKHPAP